MANVVIPPVPPIAAPPQLIALWPTIYTKATTAKPVPVDPSLAFAQAVAESGGSINNTNTTSTTSTVQSNANPPAIGIFQLQQPTSAGLGYPDPTNNTQNISAGMQYMSNLLQKYNGDYNLALAAYNAGPGTVDDFMHGTNKTGKNPNHLVTGGIPPFSETHNYIAKIQGNAPNSSSGSSSAIDIKDLNRQPTEAVPLNSEISQASYNSLQPSLFPDIVVKDGLSDITPWYEDTSLITGNPRLRQQVQPVTFRVILGDNIDTFTLSSGGRTGAPIEIQLNASMKSFSVSSKHLYHNQRTRTAFHVTMWGMQADIIEGQCTTGVFMNQLGITDYFSTFDVDENLKRLVTSGMTLSNSPSAPLGEAAQSQVLGEGGITGGVVSAYQTVGSGSDFQNRLNSIGTNNTSAFRVAAQDAFQELLSLFKMNGAVWFYNRPYQDGVGTVRQWDGVQAWSPQLGLSSSQENARNNDVMTRGTVQMQFRNFVYEGYFKTLTWTMDAANPFKWDFQFTFQVERTIGTEFLPAQ
jgi:hypothetical protein